MEPHLELEALGILRQTKLPPEYAWLTDEEKRFLLSMRFAGEAGLARSQTNRFQKKHAELFLNLSVRSLIDWQTDRFGKPSRLVLTWKGQELADLLLTVAKHDNRRNKYIPPKNG